MKEKPQSAETMRIEEIQKLGRNLMKIGEKAKSLYYAGIDIKQKASQYDIATQADEIIEKDLKDLIRCEYKGARILGEESGGKTGNEYWTIDPIDGSAPYSAGLPTWSMAISRIMDNEFVFSAIYVPYGITGSELYFAAKNKGVFCTNGVKIHVSGKTDLNEANIYIRNDEIRNDQDGSVKKLNALSRMVWGPGSTSLALAYLAAGKLDVVFAKDQNIWDCAGVLLVSEAGGKVSSFKGKYESTQSILATNGSLHEQTMKIIGNSV